MEVKRKDQSKGESSRKSPMENMWKTLWALPVPNVVKMFLWRACNNILPTKKNLFKKRVVSNMVCPICEREVVLYGCAHLLKTCAGLDQPNYKSIQETAPVLFLCFMVRCESQDVELMAVTAREIWMHRNFIVHGDPFAHPDQVMREAKLSLMEFHSCNNTGVDTVVDRETQPILGWQAPTYGILKVN